MSRSFTLAYLCKPLFWMYTWCVFSRKGPESDVGHPCNRIPLTFATVPPSQQQQPETQH